jgi:hypothetical protein
MRYELRIARHRSDGRGVRDEIPNHVVTKSYQNDRNYEEITLIIAPYSTIGDKGLGHWGVGRSEIAADLLRCGSQ